MNKITRKESTIKFGTWFKEGATAEELVKRCEKRIVDCE
jgi:hypothetical protein